MFVADAAAMIRKWMMKIKERLTRESIGIIHRGNRIIGDIMLGELTIVILERGESEIMMMKVNWIQKWLIRLL